MHGSSHYASRPAFPQDALVVIGYENLTMKKIVALIEASSSPNAYEPVLVWEHVFLPRQNAKDKDNYICIGLQHFYNILQYDAVEL